MSPSTLSWISQKHPERGLPWKRDVLRTTGVPVRTMLGKRKKKVGGSLNEWLDLNHYRPPQILYDSRYPHPEKSTKKLVLTQLFKLVPAPALGQD